MQPQQRMSVKCFHVKQWGPKRGEKQLKREIPGGSVGVWGVAPGDVLNTLFGCFSCLLLQYYGISRTSCRGDGVGKRAGAGAVGLLLNALLRHSQGVQWRLVGGCELVDCALVGA